MTEVAIQTSNEPTNKLEAGTTASSGLGAVIAGALAGYGGEALRNVLIELIPQLANMPAAVNLFVFLGVTVAAFFGTKKVGLAAGYNVLDAPNKPLEVKELPK